MNSSWSVVGEEDQDMLCARLCVLPFAFFLSLNSPAITLWLMLGTECRWPQYPCLPVKKQVQSPVPEVWLTMGLSLMNVNRWDTGRDLERCAHWASWNIITRPAWETWSLVTPLRPTTRHEWGHLGPASLQPACPLTSHTCTSPVEIFQLYLNQKNHPPESQA